MKHKKIINHNPIVVPILTKYSHKDMLIMWPKFQSQKKMENGKWKIQKMKNGPKNRKNENMKNGPIFDVVTRA